MLKITGRMVSRDAWVALLVFLSSAIPAVILYCCFVYPKQSAGPALDSASMKGSNHVMVGGWLRLDARQDSQLFVHYYGPVDSAEQGEREQGSLGVVRWGLDIRKALEELAVGVDVVYEKQTFCKGSMPLGRAFDVFGVRKGPVFDVFGVNGEINRTVANRMA